MEGASWLVAKAGTSSVSLSSTLYFPIAGFDQLEEEDK
jgi:hypothetical protein